MTVTMVETIKKVSDNTNKDWDIHETNVNIETEYTNSY